METLWKTGIGAMYVSRKAMRCGVAQFTDDRPRHWWWARLGSLLMGAYEKCMKRPSRLAYGVLIALSAAPVAAGGWSEWVGVGQYHVSYNGELWFANIGNTNPDGCSNVNFAVIKATHPGINRLYSGLLATKGAGGEIKYYVNGCSADRPNVTRIYFR